MSLQNSLFSEDAEEDVLQFLKNEKRRRVLLFPPVNNYRRFLIHQLVQDRYGDLLHTFSIGQGFARRTVVCYKSDYIGNFEANGVSPRAGDSVTGKSSSAMGIESQCTPTASPEHVPNKSRQVPAVEIYRPPALRRARLEKSPAGPPSVDQSTSDTSSRANRQKRPERAVYVPRHRRSAPDIENSNAPITPEIDTKLPKVIPRNKNAIDMVTIDQPVHKQLPIESNDSTVEKMQEQTISEGAINSPIEIIEEFNLDVDISENVSMESLNESDERDRRKTPIIDDDGGGIKIETSEEYNNKITREEDNVVNEKTSDERDETEVIKQTLVSKVLVISNEKEEEEEDAETMNPKPAIPMMPPEKKVKKVERPKSKPAPPPLPPSKINRDECDWDSLFDDNGDCLDPSLIEELTSSVGEVVIEKPKSNYKSYSRPVEVSSDEFGHVLEIYNFPSEFKSSDLAAVFSPFKNGGFELKWVDDTHCLGVFSSPLVAAEVLAVDHPFVKTRPLSEASALSKTKARKCSEYLHPYRSRPETCAALARRLVTKSLGVTLATARQEREQEKIVLREAKEKRRLANKQREDVWEGIIAEKPTT